MLVTVCCFHRYPLSIDPPVIDPLSTDRLSVGLSVDPMAIAYEIQFPSDSLRSSHPCKHMLDGLGLGD